MEKDVITAARTDTVLALAEKLRQYRIGAVVIVNDGYSPIGIVTERDIVQALLLHREQTLNKLAKEIMTSPVIAVPPDESIDVAADIMTDRRIRRTLVVDNGRLEGIVSFKDITNALEKSNVLLRAQAEELIEKANKDSLTGLYNKGYVLEQLGYHLELAKRSGNSMAVLMIDIDHFKKINDTYGHLCGDETLKELAQILKERSRAINIVGRYGGEEFVIIGPISGYKSAQFMAERLRSAVERHRFFWNDIEIKMTISIGVSIWNKNVNSDEQMIQIADDALYESKRSGRNQVVMGDMPHSSYPSMLSIR